MKHKLKRRFYTLAFPTIGRLTQVLSKDIERSYFRLLLQHVRGAKCFEDIRTVNGKEYKTFDDASRARGLAENEIIF